MESENKNVVFFLDFDPGQPLGLHKKKVAQKNATKMYRKFNKRS